MVNQDNLPLTRRKRGKMRIDNNTAFVQFIYPFQFDGAEFQNHADRLGQAKWPGRESLLTVWRRSKFPSDDLLPHVASYLNPPDGTAPTAYLWQLDSSVMESASGLGSKADWMLKWPHGQVSFRFEEVQLLLFLQNP